MTFVLTLASNLIEKFDLNNKRLLDIGCGDGDFLKTMVQLGSNSGIGIDPGTSNEAIEGIDFIKDYFSEKYTHLNVDFISCRHMFQDIQAPLEMLRLIRYTAKNNSGTLVYFEVPDAQYSFSERVVWNIIYEHNSWFTPASISAMLQNNGFEIFEISPLWRGEYIGVICRISDQIQPFTYASFYLSFFEAVSEHFDQVVKEWSRKHADLKSSGKKLVAWGAGARAITFLNTYDLQETIAFLVDVNPKRQGKYMPKSGHKVEHPEILRMYQPDVILITNPTYKEEITKQIMEMGISPEIISL